MDDTTGCGVFVGGSEYSPIGTVEIPLLVLLDSRLSRDELFIWLMMKRYAMNDDIFFQSAAEIANKLNMKLSLLSACLKRLELFGLMIRRERNGSVMFALANVEMAYCDSNRMIKEDVLDLLRNNGESVLFSNIISRRDQLTVLRGALDD